MELLIFKYKIFYKRCEHVCSPRTTRWNNFSSAKNSESDQELGSERKKWHRHENTNAKRTTSILRPGNRLHEVRRVAVGQYGPVHCPSFRPSSRSFTWLFLPVRGHNERFLASPIVPFCSMSFVPTIRSLDPRRPLLHAQVTRNLFLGSLLGNVSNVIYKSQTKRVHWSQIIVCVFFAASSIKIFFRFLRENFLYEFLRGECIKRLKSTQMYIYTHTHIYTIHACTYMRIHSRSKILGMYVCVAR